MRVLELSGKLFSPIFLHRHILKSKEECPSLIISIFSKGIIKYGEQSFLLTLL